MMKKKSTCLLMLAFTFVANVFAVEKEAQPLSSENNEPMQAYVLSTGANGEIAAVNKTTEAEAVSWRIKDLSGPTNIRNKPSGKVCMKLKAWTDYVIYTKGASKGWLSIASIYNETEGYWVRLHSSSTGTYWIAASILY